MAKLGDVVANGENIASFQRRSPSQARGRATVDAILEAAARIIRKDGTQALSTNRISEVAGVGVATLYGYFPNKTAILVALARRLMAQDEAELLAALQAAGPGEGPRIVVRTLLRRHREDAALRRAVMSVHHGQGLAAEHTEAAQRTIGRLLSEQQPGLDLTLEPLRLFVLTRAVLGVARALVEESAPGSEAALEDEVLGLVERFLSAPVG